MLLMVEKGIRWGIYHSVYSDFICTNWREFLKFFCFGCFANTSFQKSQSWWLFDSANFCKWP